MNIRRRTLPNAAKDNLHAEEFYFTLFFSRLLSFSHRIIYTKILAGTGVAVHPIRAAGVVIPGLFLVQIMWHWDNGYTNRLRS